MMFEYQRPIRFSETDAAGVVYFANVLTLCHEAYEESLMAAGIELKTFFQNPEVAVPIVHAEVDFFRPFRCGDRLAIHLTPQGLDPQSFEIHYELWLSGQPRSGGRAMTRHVCIHPGQRSRMELPAELQRWLHQWGGER